MDASRFEPRSEDGEVILVNEPDEDSRSGSYHDERNNQVGIEEDDEVVLPTLKLSYGHTKVQALNFWASLLDEGKVPSIERLSLEDGMSFEPFGVLIELKEGFDAPKIAHIGDDLARECGMDPAITDFAGVPPETVLYKIEAVLLRVIDKQSPQDFEIEGESGLGAVTFYHGLALPFTSDGKSIDHVYVVVNWLSDPEDMAHTVMNDDAGELLLEHELVLEGQGDEPDGAVDSGNAYEPVLVQIPVRTKIDTDTGPRQSNQACAGNLRISLAKARQSAGTAADSEERSRAALYEALSFAYDFSLAATQNPDEFCELLAEAGITVQARAPMSPLIKLVFGVHCARPRVAEYSTVLTHAHRIGLECGSLGRFLTQHEGGVKGVVKIEREFRRTENGVIPKPADGPRNSIAKKLRKIEAMPLSDIPSTGSEFSLVLTHRLPDGQVVMLGEVPNDVALLERAARRLISRGT